LAQDEGDRVTKAFNTILTYLGNIVRSPAEEKYRKINLNNAAFQVSPLNPKPTNPNSTNPHDPPAC
jgi:hypothetical protein